MNNIGNMKAVIFDMDGVMFDTERLCIDAWNYANSKLGLKPAGKMVFRTLGLNVNSVNRILKEEYGETFNLALFRKYCDEYTSNYISKNKVPVKDGLYDLLGYLNKNNYKTAVASSSNKTTIIRNLKSAGIENCFDAIVSGDMIKKSKPEPDIYLNAVNLLGLLPEQCYAVEDSKNGILSAYRAGCRVIMVPDLWSGDSETDKKLFSKCKDLSEVEKIVENSK